MNPLGLGGFMGVRSVPLKPSASTAGAVWAQAVGDADSPTRVASYVVSGIGFLGGGVT
ncbi:putative membrane protein YhiD involved in acid resistance [Streptomyces griseochromogenes]|uniref:Membrane protein YhiD involved in acid resistance n=1 Tax=Streptomyces griseochromogenes TaxID=68214 RepID=A0ABS4LIT3_9ACTN|nr:hypothetical protein [Streptomyces griseochromogenes]MBP2047293.1 putative membrane protein YhiD involved in acid resistance [Streptomyces griseochromogenes]